MTKEFLYKQIAEIDKVAKMKKNALYREYVRTSAKYHIGDIISDAAGTIRVESISFDIYRGDILIIYYGPMLTKKLEPRKDGTRRGIYESRIKD